MKGRKANKSPAHQSWHPAADDLCHYYVLYSAADVIRFPKTADVEKTSCVSAGFYPLFDCVNKSC